MKYSLADINENYLSQAIKGLKERYLKLAEYCVLFNKDVLQSTSSVIKLDPVKKEKIEFEFPMAYYIHLMYYYVLSEANRSEAESAMSIFRELFIQNPIYTDYNFDVDKTVLFNTRAGFLYYLCTLKIKLEKGESFTAKELAISLGVTTAAITNRIRRGTAKFSYKKNNGVYTIPNSDVKQEIIGSKKSTFLT